MAHENGDFSSFDSLCPELLDSIFEKVARDDPPALKQLARVNTAFSDAAKRCHQALVLRPLKKKQTQEARHACRTLSEQLASSRPKLSKLVVKKGAPTSLLGAAATVAWRSASIAGGSSGPPLSAVQCAQRLSAARVSMKILDLTSSSFHLIEDIESIVDFFPNLEHLKLCGQFCRQRFQVDDMRSSLKSLDVSLLSSTGTSTIVERSVFLNVLVVRFLKGSISSLVMKDEGPFQLFQIFPEIFGGLKRLNLELVDQLESLNNSLLQNLVEQCPLLEQLILYSGKAMASEQPLDVLSVLAKYPQLERLAISRARVSRDFVWEVLNRGIMRRACMQAPSAVLSKILVEREKGLEDLVREDQLLVCRLKEFSIFTTTVSDSSAAPVLRQDRLNIRKQAIGDAGVVQSWWDTFFQAKFYEG
jgi:hypothetical protein